MKSGTCLALPKRALICTPSGIGRNFLSFIFLCLLVDTCQVSQENFNLIKNEAGVMKIEIAHSRSEMPSRHGVSFI
jgi:hypothetical protein